MLRSMSSAISGMNAFEQQLDVVGNNIANVNTTGYKAASTEFSDMLSQTVSGGSQANLSTGTVTLGGTNPMQVGLGVKVASIDVNFGQGPDDTTGVATNLSVNGSGLFSVSQDGGRTMEYTRAGDFTLDANNDLVLPDGAVAMGIMTRGTPPISPMGGGFTPVNLNTYVKNYYGGATSPSLSGSPNLTIGQDGSLNVTDTAGNRIVIGYLAMATFANPSGLMRAGDSLFQVSSNSGLPTYQVAGTNGSGTLMSGMLEGSNVDLTKEFADMIVAQNGFAANSHMIGTDNQVLQDIVNLKNS